MLLVLAHRSSLSEIPLQSLPALEQNNIPTHLGVIPELANSRFEPPHAKPMATVHMRAHPAPLPTAELFLPQQRGRRVSPPHRRGQRQAGGPGAASRPAGRGRASPPCSLARPPAHAARGQWPLGAARRRPIGDGLRSCPGKWRRCRWRDGCGTAAAVAMPGSRRRGLCLRPAALRKRSGGEEQLTRQQAELPAEEGAVEGGAGRGLPAGEAACSPRAAGTAGAAPGGPDPARHLSNRGGGAAEP